MWLWVRVCVCVCVCVCVWDVCVCVCGESGGGVECVGGCVILGFFFYLSFVVFTFSPPPPPPLPSHSLSLSFSFLFLSFLQLDQNKRWRIVKNKAPKMLTFKAQQSRFGICLYQIPSKTWDLSLSLSLSLSHIHTHTQTHTLSYQPYVEIVPKRFQHMLLKPALMMPALTNMKIQDKPSTMTVVTNSTIVSSMYLRQSWKHFWLECIGHREMRNQMNQTELSAGWSLIPTLMLKSYYVQ